jgi:hypothetical protein
MLSRWITFMLDAIMAKLWVGVSSTGGENRKAKFRAKVPLHQAVAAGTDDPRGHGGKGPLKPSLQCLPSYPLLPSIIPTPAEIREILLEMDGSVPNCMDSK